MTYTLTLTDDQIKIIENKHKDHAVDLTTKYMAFRAKIDLTTLTIYKTNKVLIQGHKSEEIYKDICKLLNITPIITKKKEKLINFDFSIIGTDEVGTGDYFGGIAVCACFVPKDKILIIKKLGVKDSKKISDKKIIEIAPKLIKELSHSIIYLNNEKYNKIMQIPNMNLNKIKAILHNKVILRILEKNIKYDKIIIDGFTTQEKYFSYLNKQKQVYENVHLEMQGESKHTAIAAASIIARYYFLKKISNLAKKYNYNILKGASNKVDMLIAEIIRNGNKDILPKIAKLNFKNTKKAQLYLFNKQ